MKHTRHATRLTLSASSGTLLFLSDFPMHAWALQLVALVPWLWVLSSVSEDRTERGKHRWLLHAAVAGFVLGVFYTVPLLVVTAFPWIMALGLGLYITAVWVVLSLVTVYVLRWPGIAGAFGAGAAAVIAEWVASHAVPVWGTAQSFVRVWSAAPWAIQFVDVTGTPGIVFCLVTTQTLALRIVRGAPTRGRHAVALAVLIAVVAGYDTYRWYEKPSATLRAAAVGWVYDQLPGGIDTPGETVVREVLLPKLDQGVQQGAVLLVTPETGFAVDASSREALFAPLRQFARAHRVTLAVGYFDDERNDNRIAVLDETGQLAAEYRKTHLIPILESYTAGDGSRFEVTAAGHRVGGMICQDDNFTDIASGYGRDRVPIVVVPTNDWHAVKDYHFENSRMRSMENRYAVVRAATGGISAIVSARGEVLAQADHFVTGPSVVVADIPVLRAGSVHAWARHGFVLVCAAALGALAFAAGRGRRRG